MVRGNREQPRPGGGWSKSGTVERPDRYESRRNRPFALELSGSFGYDRGLISDKWEIPVRRSPLPAGVAPLNDFGVQIVEAMTMLGHSEDFLFGSGKAPGQACYRIERSII